MDGLEPMTGIPSYESGPVRITEADFDRVYQPKGVTPNMAAMTSKTYRGFRGFVQNLRSDLHRGKVDKKIKEYNTKLREIETYSNRVESRLAEGKSSNLLAIKLRVRKAEKAGKELAKLGVKIFALENKQAKLEGKPKAIKVPSEVVDKSIILSAIGLMKLLDRRQEKKIIREEVSKIMKEVQKGETGDFESLQKENLADFVIQKMKEKGIDREMEAAERASIEQLGGEAVINFRGEFVNAINEGNLSPEDEARFRKFCADNGLDFSKELKLAYDTDMALGGHDGPAISSQAEMPPVAAFDIKEAIRNDWGTQIPDFTKTAGTPPVQEEAAFDLQKYLKENRAELISEFNKFLEQRKTNTEPQSELAKALQEKIKADAALQAFRFSGENNPEREAELLAAVERSKAKISSITEETVIKADDVINRQSEAVVQEQAQVDPEEASPRITIEPVVEQVEKEPIAPIRIPSIEIDDNYNPIIDSYSMADIIAEILPDADIRNEKGKIDADKILTVQRTRRLELDNFLVDHPEYEDRFAQLQILDTIRNKDGSLSKTKLKLNPEIIDKLTEINQRQTARHEQYLANERAKFEEGRQGIIEKNRERSEALRQSIAARKNREMFYKVGSDYSSVSDKDLNELVTTLSPTAVSAFEERGRYFDEVAAEIPMSQFRDDKDRWYSHVVSLSKARYEEAKTVSQEESRTR